MKVDRLFVAAVAALALLTGLSLAADLKSGPQEGEKLPGAFHPYNVNGDSAGEKHCLYCDNGDNPVAMIFARELTPELTKLIKAIDRATVKEKGKRGSFVVFLGDKDILEPKLKNVVEKEKIERCILSIDSPAGPERYNVARAADVTVVLYKERVVKANFAFKKGELKGSDIEKVVKGLPKILD
jgi:hypothetical protein